ncbi:MAG: HAMP domain-containing sensor histidine kinase [Actinomycetota bacterium]
MVHLDRVATFLHRRATTHPEAPDTVLGPVRRRWPWFAAVVVAALAAGTWTPEADIRLVAGYVSLAATGALAAAALATGVLHRDGRTPARISQAVALLSLAFASSLTASLLQADEVVAADHRRLAVVLASVAAVYDLGPTARSRSVLVAVALVAGIAGLVLTDGLAVPHVAAPLAVGVVVAAGWRSRVRGAMVMAVAIGGGEVLIALGGEPPEWALARQGALALAAGLWVLAALVDSYRRLVLAREADLRELAVARQERERRERARLLDSEERQHDARAAVLAVRSAAQLLGQATPESPELRAALAEAVDAEVLRLQRLFDGERHDLGPVDVGVVASQVIALQQSLGLEVVGRMPPGITVVADHGDLADILRTLLDNARRHGGGLTIVSARTNDAEILIDVVDQGPGVSVDELDAVFERGRRGQAASGPGSGFGLYRARSLARSMGGELWAESPAVGARFVLRLPAAET